jgi:dCMP deaminase
MSDSVFIVGERPSKELLMAEIARITAFRSTCLRAHVGAVITNDELTNIVSMGYNGTARALPNGCDDPKRQGDCGCVHAEANALIKAPYDRGHLFMFTTTTPCVDCAKLIINSRVSRVYAQREYRDPTGAHLLVRAGVQLHMLLDGKFYLANRTIKMAEFERARLHQALTPEGGE